MHVLVMGVSGNSIIALLHRESFHLLLFRAMHKALYMYEENRDFLVCLSTKLMIALNNSSYVGCDNLFAIQSLVLQYPKKVSR